MVRVTRKSALSVNDMAVQSFTWACVRTDPHAGDYNLLSILLPVVAVLVHTVMDISAYKDVRFFLGETMMLREPWVDPYMPRLALGR